VPRAMCMREGLGLGARRGQQGCVVLLQLPELSASWNIKRVLTSLSTKIFAAFSVRRPKI